jgi:hypothetical protein
MALSSTASTPSDTSSTSPPPTNTSHPNRETHKPSSLPPSASKRFLQTLRIPSFHSGVGVVAQGLKTGRSTSAFITGGGKDGVDNSVSSGGGGGSTGWKGRVGMFRSLSDGEFPIGNGKGRFETSDSLSPTSSYQSNGGQHIPPLSPPSSDSFGTTTTTTTTTTTNGVMAISQSLPEINTNTKIEIDGLPRASDEVVRIDEVVETIRAPSRLAGNGREHSSFHNTPSSFMTIASQSKRGSILDLTWSEQSGAGNQKIESAGSKEIGGGGPGKRNGVWIVSVSLEPGKKGEKEDGMIDWGKKSVVIYANSECVITSLVEWVTYA